MKSTPFQKDLDRAVDFVNKRLGKSPVIEYPIQKPQIGAILGTGWKNSLQLNPIFVQIPLKDIPGFEMLDELEGHDRILQIGLVGDRLCVVLLGRVHMNEAPPSNEDVFRMVRLQVELLIALGAETIILTNAAGSLRESIVPGTIVIIDGFLRHEAGVMLLVDGEFVQADSVLDNKLRIEIVDSVARVQFPRAVLLGAFVMTRGPDIESIYEKEYMAQMHNSVMCVGMSTLPETLVCAHHKMKVLAISCISNGMYEWPSHEEVLRRLTTYAPDNEKLLRETILSIPVCAGLVVG